jgi:hypothetical protein
MSVGLVPTPEAKASIWRTPPIDDPIGFIRRSHRCLPAIRDCRWTAKISDEILLGTASRVALKSLGGTQCRWSILPTP